MPLKEPDNINAIWITITMFKDVMLGVIGGAIAYLFDFSKARRNNNAFVFQISGMCINMAFGAFVAYMIGSLIPIDTAGRDAMVGVSGVTSYQILLIAESRLATVIINKFIGEDKSEKSKDKEDKC